MAELTLLRIKVVLLSRTALSTWKVAVLFCLFLSHIALIRINQKGWQFSNLITGRNVNDLSPENVYLILLSVSLY